MHMYSNVNEKKQQTIHEYLRIHFFHEIHKKNKPSMTFENIYFHMKGPIFFFWMNEVKPEIRESPKQKATNNT